MKELNENNFKEEISNRDLVLVDFYATWCGPCELQGKILEKLVNSREKLNFEIVKVNVDNAVNLSRDYEIDSIPTLMVFKKNELKKKMVGLSSAEQLLEIMDSFED